MYRFHRYNLIRWDISSPSVAYKLFVRGLYDYVIVKEGTSSGVTTRGYFVAAKGLETSWNNRASLTYSSDIKGRKLVNEGQNWLAAAGRTFTGLLDTYGGAAAAYSLRLLSTDYAGNAVTVRRSSDNQTINIGFVDGELNTGALNTFCSGADGFVTVWHDQSGNGNNATQSTASQQPKIFDSANGVLLQNGKPTLSFDGIDDSIAMSGLAGKTRLDQYYVNTTYDNLYIYPNGNDSGNYGFVAQQGSASTVIYANYGIPVLYGNSVLMTGTTRNDVYNSLNGNKLVVQENANTSAWAGFNFGRAGAYIDCNLQEFIAYDSNQSSNRIGIESNINDFYSIY